MELRNSFLLARGPCGQCRQNFDSKFDLDVLTESGISQFQKKLDLVHKLRFCANICPHIERVLEGSNNTYIETLKSIHQIETDIEQTTGQSIETIQLALHAEKTK